MIPPDPPPPVAGVHTTHERIWAPGMLFDLTRLPGLSLTNEGSLSLLRMPVGSYIIAPDGTCLGTLNFGGEHFATRIDFNRSYKSHLGSFVFYLKHDDQYNSDSVRYFSRRVTHLGPYEQVPSDESCQGLLF